MKLIVVAIAAAFLTGCGSSDPTEAAKNSIVGSKASIPAAQPNAAGRQAGPGTAMLGPGAVDAEKRIGSKVH